MRGRDTREQAKNLREVTPRPQKIGANRGGGLGGFSPPIF